MVVVDAGHGGRAAFGRKRWRCGCVRRRVWLLLVSHGFLDAVNDKTYMHDTQNRNLFFFKVLIKLPMQ